MNDLYESLVAWSAGTHRTIGRATSLRGAPRDAIRARAELTRRLASVAAPAAGPWERPVPPSEPMTAARTATRAAVA